MDTKWLSDLERKVEAAAAELKKLRQETRTQKTKIKQLQQQLSKTRGAQSKSDWAKERKQIRERVEKLAAGLEKLL